MRVTALQHFISEIEKAKHIIDRIHSNRKSQSHFGMENQEFS